MNEAKKNQVSSVFWFLPNETIHCNIWWKMDWIQRWGRGEGEWYRQEEEEEEEEEREELEEDIQWGNLGE